MTSRRALAVVLGLCLTGCWGQFRADPAHSGNQPFESTIGPPNVPALAQVWTAATAAPIRSSPAIVNGVVYVGSDNGKLYALDAAGLSGCSGGPKTCAPLWSAATGAAVGSSPTVVNGIVYVGSNDGKLYAFDAAGAVGCSGSPKTCAPLWSAPTGGAVASSPAVMSGSVYVGSADGKLHVFGLVANQASTATALVSSANPSTFGSSVTFTATVTSSGGTPFGTVTFSDGGVTIGTGTLAGGQTTLTISTLSVGTHAITAGYAATGNFAASTSVPVSQVVNASGSTLFVDRSSPTCTNSGTGTPAAPFCTINAASQKVTAGQTVSVAAGTYPEQVTVVSSGTPTAPIVYTPAPGATVTVTGAANAFSISGKSWVTIHGFNVTATTSHAITVTSSSNITIDANHVTAAGQPSSGLTAFAIHFNAVTQSRITNNTTDHNSDAGLHVVSASNNNVITGNVSFSNARGYVRAAAGIDVRDSTGNVVSANVSHDNEDSGINAWTGVSNGQNTFFDNVVYGNGDHGIDVHNAVDAHVIANTVYGNVDSGIESTTSTRTYLANNVSIDNGINSPRTSGDLRIDAGSVGTAVLNDDLVFLRVSGTVVDWAGTKYTSLAAFRAATGQESRGLEADPRFRSIASADFHLVAGSPAIDSANSGSSGQPNLDFDGSTRFDDPATVNTGIGPVAYADRGAFEYRP